MKRSRRREDERAPGHGQSADECECRWPPSAPIQHQQEWTEVDGPRLRGRRQSEGNAGPNRASLENRPQGQRCEDHGEHVIKV